MTREACRVGIGDRRYEIYMRYECMLSNRMETALDITKPA